MSLLKSYSYPCTLYLGQFHECSGLSTIRKMPNCCCLEYLSRSIPRKYWIIRRNVAVAHSLGNGRFAACSPVLKNGSVWRDSVKRTMTGWIKSIWKVVRMMLCVETIVLLCGRCFQNTNHINVSDYLDYIVRTLNSDGARVECNNWRRVSSDESQYVWLTVQWCFGK